MNKPTLGRPPIYITDEERLAARKATMAKSKEKFRNVALHPDVMVDLKAVTEDLEDTLGVRLTMSQTLRYLINKARKA